MQEPLSIPRFIALVTETPVEKPVVAGWFNCVRQHAPNGMLLNIPTTDDTGMPKTVCLVHREDGSQHRYMVPLARDLGENEGGAIVDAFQDLFPDLDFDIHSSATHATNLSSDADHDPITVDREKYMNLCAAWAKRQHETWLQDRADNGWRYGAAFSIKDKTNPLMLPWEQLPDRYRKPDLDEPQALLDLLNDQGYAVITKGELDAMKNLMRISSPLGLHESVAIPADLAGELQATAHDAKASTGGLHRNIESLIATARTLLDLGDQRGAAKAMIKARALIGAPIEEDLFRTKPAVPTDRLHRAGLDTADRAASRDWDPIRSQAPAYRDLQPPPITAPTDALTTTAPAFGRRQIVRPTFGAASNVNPIPVPPGMTPPPLDAPTRPDPAAAPGRATFGKRR